VIDGVDDVLGVMDGVGVFEGVMECEGVLLGVTLEVGVTDGVGLGMAPPHMYARFSVHGMSTHVASDCSTTQSLSLGSEVSGAALSHFSNPPLLEPSDHSNVPSVVWSFNPIQAWVGTNRDARELSA
jgi:hypothetical protein